MAIGGLFDRTTKLLQANLDRRTESHRQISRNLSNIDTPGYQGTGVEFEKQLRAAMEGQIMPTQVARTHAMHLPLGSKKPFSNAEPVYKDTGPVNLDIEMSKLAENNIMFQAMVQLLNKKYALLKSVIASDSGGG